MIFTDNQTVSNFANALWGMRNPLESWHQSDSLYGIQDEEDDLMLINVRDKWMHYNGYGDCLDCKDEREEDRWWEVAKEIESWLWFNGLQDRDGAYINTFYIGPRDMKLAQNLIRAGADESKFMRQIFVSVDITAPFYWWKEMDTYKVGTTANSTSTMHKLCSQPITYDDFSIDKEVERLNVITATDFDGEPVSTYSILDIEKDIISSCELIRQMYIKTGDKQYWRALIQLLPESYNQTRTWTANYAVLRNIYFARRNHKLQEWRDFCKWIETLPYAKELICLEEKKENETL